MFGFDKERQLGNMESAFGGAAVMNMVNKMGSKPQKRSSANSSNGNTGNVRMASSNGTGSYVADNNSIKLTDGIPKGGATGETPISGLPTGETHISGSPTGKTKMSGAPTDKATMSGTPISGKTTTKNPLDRVTRNTQRSPGKIRNMFGKVKNKAGEIYNKPKIRGVRAVGGKVFKAAVKGVARGTFRITGAATLGTIGLAAGIATGKIENAFAGAIGGITAGNRIGSTVADIPSQVGGNASRIAREIRETFEEGSLGEEKAEKQRNIREFKKTREYRDLLERFPNSHEKINSLLNAGITDASKIRIALNNTNNYSTDNAIAYINMAKTCPDNIFEDRDKFTVYLESHGIPKEKADEIYRAVREFK